jgi:hypothetical protein
MGPKQKRTFNYLGRADIPGSAFHIKAVATDAGVACLLLKLDVADATRFGQRPDVWLRADVWVEAWRSASTDWARERICKVGEVSSVVPMRDPRPLEGFAAADGVKFTIKIVDSETGKLLARGSSAGDCAGGVDDLLPVQVEPSLKEVPWRIQWSNDHSEGPVLLVSAQLDEPSAIVARDVRAKAATLPQVLREVMHRLAMDIEARESEWGKFWLQLMNIDNERMHAQYAWTEAMVWAEGVVEDFCQQKQWVTKVNRLGQAEGEQ